MTDKVIVIRGKLDWAKVIGPAKPYRGNPKFDKGPSWSLDITPDAKSLELLKQMGISDKLRDPDMIRLKAKKANRESKETRTEPFLSLSVLENRDDGTKNSPPKITDIRGNPWGNDLLGNGTVADVKVKVKDYGSAVKKGTYLQAIRVLELVPYESEDFEPLSEDDEFFAQAAQKNEAVPSDNDSDDFDVETDDDIPF